MVDPLKIDEQPRGLRYGDVGRSPTDLMLRQMRRHSRAVSAVLARVAYEHFELEHVLKEVGTGGNNSTHEWEAVAIIVAQLGDLLSEYGVTTENPIGQTWVDSMRAEYVLIGFDKCEGIQTPLVGHVNKPVIRRLGRLIGKGEVTVSTPVTRTTGSGDLPTKNEKGT